MESSRIKVLCIDDSADVARLYARLVDSEPGMQCVGVLDCADHLTTEARRLGPDVVVLDLTMPGRDPLEALRELSAAIPDVRVIVFSGHSDRQTIDSAVMAGAWGFVAKHSDPMDVLACIRRVASGESSFPDGHH